METNPDNHPEHDADTAESSAPSAGTATMERDTTDPTDHTEATDGPVTEPMNDDPTSERPRWSPPAPPPPPVPKRSWLDVPIAKDRDERRVGGVVAGVSKAYDFDRRTSRIATALGALVIPGIFALYIAAMVFMPGREDQPRTIREIVTDRRRRPLMVVFAIIAIATGFGSWAFWGGLGWGFALVAVGVVLWLAPNIGSTDTEHVRLAAGPGRAPYPTPSAPATPVKVRRRRYPIQAGALGVASVGALIAGIGNTNDWWDVSVYSIVLTALIGLITATVAGVIVNRSWFGIPMLLMLGAVTVGLTVTHPNLDGGIGERTFRPTSVDDAIVDQHLGIGRLTVDLTDVPLDSEPLTVEASVGYGQVRIIVPADAELRIVADMNAGHVVVNGDEISSGFDREETLTVPARSADRSDHTIVLDLGVGGGEINIVQIGA